ncbi:MAG: hypothetical protein R2793_05880 [Flavobacteriaceae bacterium]
MKANWHYTLMIVAAIITLVGLVTGKFLFLLIWLPFGFLFPKKEK